MGGKWSCGSAFIGMLEVEGAPDAENIFNLIVSYFESINVDINRMTSFGSDGASVMTGIQSGVASRLRALIGDHLITIHCVSHCVALSAKSGITSCLLSTVVEDILSKISVDFSNSPKRTDELKNIASSFAGQAILRILKYHKVRWLSRTNCIGRLIEMMGLLLTFYQNGGNFKARYHQLANYGVQRFLHFVYDVLLSLSKLTKVTQEKTTNLQKIRKKYIKCVSYLRTLLYTYGRYEINFLENISPGLANTFTFHGHNLSTTFSHLDVLEARGSFLNAIIDDLERRFQALTASTDAFSIFTDIEEISTVDMHSEICRLADMYGKTHEGILQECSSFEYEVATRQFENTSEVMRFLNSRRVDFSIIHYLYQTYLSLPTSTAEVERCFSRMNRIKSPERNRLGAILVHCLFISIYGAKFNWDWKAMAKYVAKHIWKYFKDKLISLYYSYLMISLIFQNIESNLVR